MSSFVEAIETLYTDSGLSDALDGEQVVFDENLDGDFRRLGELVVRMDGARFAPAEIEGRDMDDVRELAQRTLTLSVTPCRSSKRSVHDVQANEPVARMLERLRHRADDREPERTVEPDRRGVGLGDRVELHPSKPCRARP